MLSPALQNAAERLARGSQCIAAVAGKGHMNENRFTKALAALAELAEQHSIPIAVVGGLGAIRHGYPAVTEDIDIVIASGDLERLLAVAAEHGFRISWRAESGWHTIEYQDVEINIVPEGRRAKNDAPTTIPGPELLGVKSGLDYASVSGWMELKISSFRRKDQTHVIEVLKTLAPDQIAVIRNHLSSVHELYKLRFDDLAAEAAAERAQENERS